MSLNSPEQAPPGQRMAYAPMPRPYGPQGPVVWTGYVNYRPSSGVAVWALVAGVIGLLAGWCLLGVPCLIAVVLGHVGLHDTRDESKSGRGMAVAGLILGYVALLPAVILFFWLIVGAGGAAVAPGITPSVRVS